jgi:hypothetical protein
LPLLTCDQLSFHRIPADEQVSQAQVAQIAFDMACWTITPLPAVPLACQK